PVGLRRSLAKMLAQALSTCSLASAPQAARTRGREGHAATRGTRCARGQDLPSSLAPLRKAAEPRRVMLEDMGNDVQIVGRERGLDVASGRDVGLPELDVVLPMRVLVQHDFCVFGPL